MRAGRVSVGHPVDVASGTVYSMHEDISIPGKVDLVWERRYSTALLDMPSTSLGPGWTMRYLATLTQAEDEFWFLTPEGDAELFSDSDGLVDRGGVVRNLGTFQELSKNGDRYIVTRWDVDTGEIERYVFKEGQKGEAWPLASIEDVTGQGLDMLRDRTGQLTGIQQRLEKRILLVDYTANNRIQSISFLLPDNQQQVLVRYEYDNNDRLHAAYDALGYVDRYEYDASSRIIREIVKDGGVFHFRYDEYGRCIKTSGLDGYDEKTFRYLDHIGWTEVTNSLGHVSRFQWRGDGQVVAEHDATGGIRRFEYDEEGRIVAETAPNGTRFTFAFDEQGNRRRTEDPLGHASDLTFNDVHLPVTFIDPRGGTWRRFYDRHNRLIAAEDPLRHHFTYDHDEQGRLIRFVDPLGNVFTQTFRDDSRTVELSDGKGRRIHYIFDELGQLRERTDATGATVRYRYEVRGYPVEITYPDGTQVRGRWDAAGNLLEFHDRCGRITRYKFGSCGRLLEKLEPSGGIFRYEWSSEPGRLLAVTNPGGETYRYEYNAIGRIIRETGFDGRRLELEYDAAGRLNAATNGAGKRTIYKRDPLGRLIAQILPDGISTSFSYDPMGALLTATNDQVEVVIERDPLGRIVREKQGQFYVHRTYDAMGRVTGVDTGEGRALRYEWDHVGDAVAVSAGDSARWEIRRNLRGQEENRRLPGALELSQTFAPAGQLVSQELTASGGRILTRRNYLYTGPLPTGFEDLHQGTVTYDYDAGERLVAVRRSNGPDERYAYDANGNLIFSRYDDVEESLTYGVGSRLHSCGLLRHEHDDNGRLVRRFSEGDEEGGWRFHWNAVGQLREAVDSQGHVWKYSYDVFGRLMEKAGPAGTIKYVWDEDVILHEVAGEQVTSTWVFDPQTFRPLGVVRGDQPLSLMTDSIGTPYQLVDVRGRIVWAVRHRAWGKTDALEGEPADCPIRFPGQWWMPETDLHYNRYRYYDPAVGRYVSQDPAGLTQVPSLYAYGLNPIRWIDPYGLIDEFVGDSNLFMDRPERAGTTRPICDDILADSNNTIVVPKAVRNEVTANDPNGTQQQRLTQSNADVQPVRSSNVKQTQQNHPDILSRNFDVNDLKLMQTAKQRGLPVVTNNSRLRNQIQSHPTRRQLFGSVKIIVVGEDIHSAQDLQCMT